MQAPHAPTWRSLKIQYFRAMKNVFSLKPLYKINLKQCHETPLAPQVETRVYTAVSK